MCEPQAEREAEESATALATRDADAGAALDAAAASIADMKSAVEKADRCSLLLCTAKAAKCLHIVLPWQPSHGHCRLSMMDAGSY